MFCAAIHPNDDKEQAVEVQWIQRERERRMPKNKDVGK
jgi:hypothetical protein